MSKSETSQALCAMPTSDEMTYVLRLADNAMILGQRLAEMCGHAPEMELDIALTNFSLDLIGQAALLYDCVLARENLAPNSDVLAMTREQSQYLSCLLVAQPNVDFAHIIVRHYMFVTFQKRQYEALLSSKDKQLAAIAEKALKEIAYQIRFSKAWVLRLGDGTDESHERMVEAVDCLWRYSGELFDKDDVLCSVIGSGLTADFTNGYQNWQDEVSDVFAEATLNIPSDTHMLMGGYLGKQEDHLGHILVDMQYMQLKYPNLEW